MRVNTSAVVIEFTPRDVLDYVNGEKLVITVQTDRGPLTVVWKRHSMGDGSDLDDDETKFEPILNSGGVKSLVEMAPVNWECSEMDTHIIAKLACKRSSPEHELHEDLKEAFHAHDRKFDGFDGKDPRRVWNDYQE